MRRDIALILFMEILKMMVSVNAVSTEQDISMCLIPRVMNQICFQRIGVFRPKGESMLPYLRRARVQNEWSMAL